MISVKFPGNRYLIDNDRDKPRLKSLVTTTFTQGAIQIIGIFSGFLLIRGLNVEQYAWYTISNTMLGTLTLLSDAGIGAGTMAQSAKSWNDQTRVSKVLVTAIHLRRKFAIVAALLILPVLMYLLMSNGASSDVAIVLCVCLILTFYASTTAPIYEVYLKLEEAIHFLQKTQIILNISRLGLIIVAIYIYPVASLALLSFGLPQLWYNSRLKHTVKEKISLRNRQRNREVQTGLLSSVSKILPLAIYTSISGQLIIWIISIFGSVTQVAQAGALSRIAVTMNFVTIIFHTIAVPQFAKLNKNHHQIRKSFIQIQCSLFIVSIVVLSLAAAFSDELLLVLGTEYKSLKSELLLIMVVACLNMSSRVTYSLLTSREWTISPWFSIIISLCMIILSVSIFNLSMLSGIILMTLLISAGQAILYFAHFIRRLRILKFYEYSVIKS